MNRIAAMLILSAVCGMDASAGRLAPTFIVSGGETIVASAVATHSPYNADNTGRTDATQAIQKAMDDVAAVQGGVVFLPSGKYLVKGTLTLQYGTALMGDWVSPDKGGMGKGTILLAYAGRGDADGPPFITAPSSETSVINLTIYYPEQKPDDIKPYPATISSFMSTVSNVTLCNSYNAIDMRMMNASLISDIHGTALTRGVRAIEASEFSWVHDLRFSNDYWQEAAAKIGGKPMTSEQRAAVDRFTRANLVGIELGRLDGLAVYRFSADDAGVPIRLSKNPKFPNPVFGYGGVAADFRGKRDEQGWAPWYYYMRFANVDNVPEAKGKRYEFARTPAPKRTAPASFINVTQAPYNAVGDGTADDTAAVMKALSELGRNGGGTVYLPQGRYKITSPLVIPSGVELRGPYGTGKRRAFAEACALEAYCGKDSTMPETDAAFVTLEQNSGIRGFTISHPEQLYDVKRLHAYPYTIRGKGKGVWVVDVDLLNSCYGIDFATYRCDEHLVKGMWATVFYKGIQVGGNSRGGKLERMAFSYGTWSESGRAAAIKTAEGDQAIRDFISDNLVAYVFGDCSKESAWGLVCFLPRNHFHFIKDKGQGCTDADLWLSMHDVGKKNNIVADGGHNINLIGYFGTTSGEGINNWLEVGKDFKGPINVYAKTVQQTSVNHPMDFSPGQVQFFDEVSLVSGKKASADRTDPGSDPANAVDRDPRTAWQAPAGSYLEVDLGENKTITGFGMQSAGMFYNLDANASEAELRVSQDGKTFTMAGTVSARPGGEAQRHPYSWADMPVDPVVARYVRLYVTKPGADGKISIGAFTVIGY